TQVFLCKQSAADNRHVRHNQLVPLCNAVDFVYQGFVPRAESENYYKVVDSAFYFGQAVNPVTQKGFVPHKFVACKYPCTGYAVPVKHVKKLYAPVAHSPYEYRKLAVFKQLNIWCKRIKIL